MAAELPVTDVLCEAMEYLSKLGSNLRTRSESLKEKRISKAKLKNAHAVHKAANKVLLICELSKKSLDNVETGVRKVLSLLEASQATSNIGGNTSDTKSRKNKHYHHFEYQSQKLRIAKKISLKHYTSVQVRAKSMPVSLQDKYPVYYDCKLKRQRARLARKQKSILKRKKSACISDEEQDNDKCGGGLDDEKSHNLDEDSSHRHIDNNSQSNEPDLSLQTEQVSAMVDNSQEVNELKDTPSSSFVTEKEGKDIEDKLETDSIDDSNMSVNKQIRKSVEKCLESRDNIIENNLEELSPKKLIDDSGNKHSKQNRKQNKASKSRCGTIYSSDSDNDSQKAKDKKIEVNICTEEGNGNDISVHEPKAKKLRLDESDSVSQQDSNCGDEHLEMEKESDKGDNCDRDSDSNSLNSKICSQNESGSEGKPMIRCVNLSKLLKPDILNKENGSKDKCKKTQSLTSKRDNVSSDKNADLNKKERSKKHDKKRNRKKSEEYQVQKRKEVSEFKPKEFSINVERLPSFSKTFLLAHNLQSIVKGGNVICQLANESNTQHKIDEVKNALLNDSDSDVCKESADTNKVKNCLLKDTDSENETLEREENKSNSSRRATQDNISESIENALLSLASDSDQNKSDSEQNCTDTCINNTQSEVNEETTNGQNNENICGNEESNIQSNHNAETTIQSKHKTKPTHLAHASKENKKSNNCIEKVPKEALTADANEALKSSLLNNSSDDNTEVSKNDQVTPTKANQKVKSSLLKDTSDEEFAGFSNNDQETPTKANLKVKCSLLKDSSDEKSDKNDDESTHNDRHSVQERLNEDAGSSPDGDDHSQDTQTETNLVSNHSSDEKCTRTEEASKSNDENKSPVNSSGEDKTSKDHIETPTKTNEKVKSSLLRDSSDEKSNIGLSTKDNENASSKHNESSDVNSDASDNRKEKRKTPKSKRKYARKCREARQKLRYSSSSDSEQEKLRHKRMRKKSQFSSSSSSEELTKNIKKSQSCESNSSHSDNNTARTIDQVDGPMDEQSSSSIDKMVRSKAKPSGSSSLNSDNQDATDKDIDGLTNLNSLTKNRRRDHSAKSRDDRDSIKKNNRSKETPIIGEDLLKAESSSEASDVADNEFEDLPPVTLSGLNGDGLVDHMAKDDLLGESDSSVSHNDKDQTENTDNMDETDGEENLKSKRRKANAISSDSEGGSHRRKQQQEEERMSDFEDSEDESSEPAKKSKRKKKASDSDASADSTDGGKKKRRRIKVVKDSDASGSDTENEGRNKHGRKNIRKVMGKNQLEEATKKAAREEKERIARIAERQKLYNNLDFDESGKPDEVVLEKVILDFDPETKEPLIQVDRGLVKKLKPHQANGIKFMWDACFESVKRIKKDKGSGCILAHCMGLGKTLQVISLTHTLLTHGSLTGVHRVLVVCPLSTVLNWVNEVRMWLKHAEAEFDVDVYELSRYKQNSERAFQLQQWFDGGGVCVLGYEMFRNLSADNPKKFKKKMLRSFQESLVDPGPDLVVCDEGHLLKNEKTSLSQSMNRVKTRRRIVLTGTPLQNNLKEYYCMVQFVKPNLLGKYNEYLNRFVNPITNGQYTDSTEHDIRVMKRRSHVLHKMLDGAVQRRDYGVLAPFLPPKHEYVLFITLTDVQVKLYQFYLDNYSRRPLPGKSSGFLFPDFQSLQRIWTHPLVLKYNSERYEIMQQKKREREEEDSEGSLVDFIDDDSTPEETSTEESTDELSDMSDDSRKKSKKSKKAAKKSKVKETKASTRRGTRANPVELDDDENENDDVVEVKNENPTEWWIKLVEETELEDMRNSHKLVLLFDILRQCETIGDKLLVFSQSLYSLDLIEHFLGKVDEATQEGRIDEKLGGHVGSWSPGVDYFRLDGSTSCENRSIWCKNFNREDNPRARLFLISTRAGGLGINLVAANRVVIFDVSWNPSHDVQSIFRVYRFGQKKPCYIYRFLAMGTMEEKIYERQVTKQAISKRVIDEQQIDRHYAENDLAELYKFDARPDEPRPLPTLPKDRLFAEMLKEHEAQIYKYHEHDSLLENKEEETLSEEERKAAWEDFENEKNKPPPAPFPSAWPMHNGMVPGLLAQQQQQLAYAALAAMLRKDMPNINDNQIRDMLPIIYNSNPGMFGGYDYGLMQKMSEIYKYAQPSMMNPSMMNPVMNAGSGGGGGGMGGTSGLQYEPPWQRQHQQQQQMRLQQLMQQQQNQMGAKFYAGGLGSRDPVAMALQQQRAREIMMGGAGRPRGRPPMHPRTPTATASDVVNLDSD